MFITANVTQVISEPDFIHQHRLSVDLRNTSLIDSSTKLEISLTSRQVCTADGTHCNSMISNKNTLMLLDMLNVRHQNVKYIALHQREWCARRLTDETLKPQKKVI